MIPPEQWRQVEDIFNAALGCEPAVRPLSWRRPAAEKWCSDEVEALLQQHGQAGEVLSQPIEKVVDEVLGGGGVGSPLRVRFHLRPRPIRLRSRAAGGDLLIARHT